MKIILLLLLAELAFGQATPAQPPEKRLALVIGNGTYKTATPLPTAPTDAGDIAAVLPRLGFEVLTYTNADKATMQRAIREFGAKLKGYSAGLIYYVGHAIQIDGKQFLVPTDAKLDQTVAMEPMCMLVNQFITSMESAKARTNILVLDADWAAPFVTDTLNRGAAGSLDTPVGFVVAQSTAPGRPVVLPAGRNGIYATALLKQLVIPNQTITQLFRNVRAEVVRQSNNTQLPWESTSMTEDFYLLRK